MTKLVEKDAVKVLAQSELCDKIHTAGNLRREHA